MRLRLGPGKEQPQRTRTRGDSRTVVADLATTGTVEGQTVPEQRAEHRRRHLPLVLRTHNGLRHLAGRSNKPYVRLGGLWALKGTGSGLKISLEGQRARDTMTVPASDEPVSDNAAQHPVIAKLIEEQKAVKEALAGRQGVDAEVAECHRLLDTNTTNEGTPSTTGKNVEAWLAWISTAQDLERRKSDANSAEPGKQPHTKCRGRQHAK
ncbi:hypothetical protein ERJ75_000637800 [Trypanosoma vivax]|nr:hypothetical protein ERJ75_000637800 [Trypanosoma vivax]